MSIHVGMSGFFAFVEATRNCLCAVKASFTYFAYPSQTSVSKGSLRASYLAIDDFS